MATKKDDPKEKKLPPWLKGKQAAPAKVVPAKKAPAKKAPPAKKGKAK